ncbi:uncharacterized protein CMU_013950 [Cryptosporidium muris RN66]|uniref:Uncharacterized protein n=1 Tax=Cryptosporidium muris (strain RN66) TaxID=441375 RepID=B6AEV3_CRYMR|nr:uncharacterized protein CMU_013950 [Cryptosporidium muris RN66]EEA06720.1 hypothetical protein, conserved [Cryptosporidium muris RN66]|eukprot:XP_002141069.1 hypothetical protein [Cryptosporidium muris RN66]
MRHHKNLNKQNLRGLIYILCKYRWIFLCGFYQFSIVIVKSSEIPATSIESNNIQLIWNSILEEMALSRWLHIKNLPKKAPLEFVDAPLNNPIIAEGNILKQRKLLGKRCIYALREMLETETPLESRKYSYKLKSNISLPEALARFCYDVALKHFKTQKTPSINKEINEKEYKESKNTIYKYSSKIPTNQISEESLENSEKAEVNTLYQYIAGILKDYKDLLPLFLNNLSHLRKSIQFEASKLMKNKDWKGLSALLERERVEDVVSFLDVLIGSKKSDSNKYPLLENLKANFNMDRKDRMSDSPFGRLPTREDEWKAIIEWIQSNSGGTKTEEKSEWLIRTNNKGILPENPSKNFKASNGDKDIFVKQCIYGIREITYKRFTAPSGDRYYSYDRGNKAGIIIQGKNQKERNFYLSKLCTIIFDRYFEFLGLTKIKSSSNYTKSVLSFLAPLEYDKVFLNKLIQSLYKFIDNPRRQWLAVVNEAQISPLVFSKNLPIEPIPFVFLDRIDKKTHDLELKQKMLAEKCFQAIRRLLVERFPGDSDTTIYKIEVGSEGDVSIAKFCNGTMERFIMRHLDWMRLIERSIGDPNIQLLDYNDPYVDIPELFIFVKDARLRENCISSLLAIFEENYQALEKGLPIGPYPQMVYKGKPEQQMDHIVSFCESISEDNISIRARMIENLKSENSSEDSENTSDTSKIPNNQYNAFMKIMEYKAPDLLLNIKNSLQGRLEAIPFTNSTTNTLRLEKWSQSFKDISNKQKYRLEMFNIFKRQFRQFLSIEDACEGRLKSILELENLENELGSIQWIENYIKDTDGLKTEWASELYKIEVILNNIRAAENELETYVKTVNSVLHENEKKSNLPRYKKILRDWPKELNNKERLFEKLKIDGFLGRQQSEVAIESLRYQQLERRNEFIKHLKNNLLKFEKVNKFFDIRICMNNEEGLYPIIPFEMSLEEEEIQKQRLTSLKLALNEFFKSFSVMDTELSKQFHEIDKALQKKQGDFNKAWKENYETALALQLQIRTRKLVEEYVQTSERYLLIQRVKADFEYRKSIISEFQMDPGFEVMLSRAADMIEKAEVESKELKEDLNKLSKDRARLPKIIEQDMKEIYSKRVKELRSSRDILRKQIQSEKAFLNKEREIFEDQLHRDTEYYSIDNMVEAGIYRGNQLQILCEATQWIMNYNEKLTFTNEMVYREDLEKLDYVVSINNTQLNKESEASKARFNSENLMMNLRKHKFKYNDDVNISDFLTEDEMKREAGEFAKDDPSQGQIPEDAQKLLEIYKEKLKWKLNDLDSINQSILQLNMNTIGAFDYFDYNRERAYKAYFAVMQEAQASNMLYIILSHFEWEHIQLRWRILQMEKFVIGEKERILNQIADLRSTLDLKMKQYNAVPLMRRLVPIGSLSLTDPIIRDILEFDRKKLNLEGNSNILDIIPSSIPLYLIDGQDYKSARNYDYKVKNIILDRIMVVLSVKESKYIQLLKNIMTKYTEKNMTYQKVIDDMKAKLEGLQNTIGFTYLSSDEKKLEKSKLEEELQEQIFISSQEILPLVMQKQIILQKAEQLNEFQKRLQKAFNDPSFTGEEAKQTEASVIEFFGEKPPESCNDLSPKVQLAFEIYKLNKLSDNIKKLEKQIKLKGTEDRDTLAKLHKNKRDISKTEELIQKLKKEIQTAEKNAEIFQNTKFAKLYN